MLNEYKDKKKMFYFVMGAVPSSQGYEAWHAAPFGDSFPFPSSPSRWERRPCGLTESWGEKRGQDGGELREGAGKR